MVERFSRKMFQTTRMLWWAQCAPPRQSAEKSCWRRDDFVIPTTGEFSDDDGVALAPSFELAMGAAFLLIFVCIVALAFGNIML